jgi:LPPG:FO 2-phospho-L-lactate transferase
MLTELGHEASVVGVARLYAPIAAALVIDPVDAEHAAAVEAAGMRAVVAPSVMSTPRIAADLASTVLAAVGG